MTHASFDGLRVLSLESRRAQEVAKLIRTYGGEPVVVPAMREVPLESNKQALEFLDSLLHGKFDLVIFLTGVGIRALLEIAQVKYEREEVLNALRSVKIAARGPKPGAVLKELKIPVAATAPEPNTWREMMRSLEAEFGDRLSEMRVAVQEYGTSNPEFLSELTVRCAEVTRVPVYQWRLPEDTGPLRECVLGIANGSMDVVLFMTGVQVIHLFQIAEQMGQAEELREGLGRMAVVSIGPATTEELTRYGITPDFEPSHPKMGFMVNEAAQFAGKILERKRGKTDGANPGVRIVKGKAASRRNQASAPKLRDGLDFLHEVSSRLAAADSFHVVLGSIVDFVTAVIPCDSCFIYVLEQEKLVLRASKNPHADLVDRMGMELGQGITGWVAEHREPVAIASGASSDPRFVVFRNLPEDYFEAILCTPILCASKVVGVITLQHRMSYEHTANEIRLLSMLGFLVGAEIERTRLETENAQLAGRLETRKAVDRAKGILQRDLAINEDEAYRMMQRESRQRRLSMREIADAIVLSDELKKTTRIQH
ncbi:MAG TPA: uroporphyrinogen-III synthase [Edaphobacter sp.]|nr:uroporphyrinogen-III synthase [Edaphobacter sp.]